MATAAGRRAGAAGRRVAVIVMLVQALLLGGCASLPFTSPSILELERAGVAQVRDRHDYVFSHGTGDDRQTALLAAREQLAGQLLTHIRSEMRLIEQELATEESRELTRQARREFASASQSLVNVELEGVVVDQERRGRDGWYVRLKVPVSGMERLRARARSSAPALARVEATQAIPAELPGRRLRSALRGLAVVHEHGLADSGLLTAGGERTSFEAFFLAAVETSVERLRALPLVDGSRVRFVLLDRSTLTPQPGLTIAVGGHELTSDQNGYTDYLNLYALPERLDIVMLGYSAQRSSGEWRHPPRFLLASDSFSRGQLTAARQAELYVYTRPGGAVVQSGRDELVAPGTMRVATGNEYRLTASYGDDYRAGSETVTVPEGAPYAFAALELTQRRYGRLELSVAGRRPWLQLSAPQLGHSFVASDGHFAGEVEAGHYDVLIGRRGNSDYQQVHDRVLVLEGGEVVRNYRPPGYRQPYHHGIRLAFVGQRLGGEPADNFRMPWLAGEEIDYAASSDSDLLGRFGHVGPNADLALLGQVYLNRYHLTVQAALGQRRHRFTVTEGTGEFDLALHSSFVSVGAGFWRSFWGDRLVGSVTLNQAYEGARWTEQSRGIELAVADNERQRLGGGTVDNSYSFIELGSHWRLLSLFDMVDLTVAAVIPLGGMQPYVTVGVGLLGMTRGYRHPASARARAGAHY